MFPALSVSSSTIMSVSICSTTVLPSTSSAFSAIECDSERSKPNTSSSPVSRPSVNEPSAKTGLPTVNCWPPNSSPACPSWRKTERGTPSSVQRTSRILCKPFTFSVTRMCRVSGVGVKCILHAPSGQTPRAAGGA